MQNKVKPIDQQNIISRLTSDNNRNVWIQIGLLLDGDSDKPIENAHIVYNSDEIIYVNKSENLPPKNILALGQTEPDLHLPDYTILPGLIDAHIHIFLQGSELDPQKRQNIYQKSFNELIASAENCLNDLTKFGVIAVRDAGDKLGIGLSLSGQYKMKEKDSKCYIDSPGAAINHKNHYGDFMSTPIENYPSLEDAVKARIETGADRIKLIATGIIDFKDGIVKSNPQLTSEEIKILVNTAKLYNKQTFAHASGDKGIDNVIEGNVDSIEHGYFIRKDQLAKMRDKQIAWVPTFAPLQAQIDNADIIGLDEKVISNLKRILESHAETLNKANEIGVKIIAGSDSGSQGVPHGWGLLYEMELMAMAGIPILKIINTATGISSGRLNFKEKFGKIKKGYCSRFILTKNSPLINLSNLRKEKYIVNNGTTDYIADEKDTLGL